jgi:hypothetical protein
LLIISCALGIVVVASSPAYAYLARAYVGANYASVGEDRIHVEVCDLEQDGNGVRGEFEYNHYGLFTVRDSNGSAAGCGNGTMPGLGAINRFRVCEEQTFGDQCSGWKDVPAPVTITHVLIRNWTTSRCIDLPGTGSGYAGGPVNQWGCVRNDNEDFTFVSQGSGFWWIRNDKDNLCLDLPGTGWVGAGTQVVEYYCASYDNQYWYTGSPRFQGYVDGIQRDFYRLQNVYWNGSAYVLSGLCLEVPGTGTGGDGVRLQVYYCADNDDHDWTWY